jgi:GxxExxY protein
MLHEQLSERIIACEIEVHRHLGPGLPEHNYGTASAIEFKYHGIAFVRERCRPVF